MNRSLPLLNDDRAAHACVWSDAGVIAHRPCDRAFACDRCPLDAALRGDPRLTLRDDAASSAHAHVPWTFPADRLYAPSHVWIQVMRAGRARAGIDACAAWVMPPVIAVSVTTLSAVARGEPLCTLTGVTGELNLSSPISGAVLARNERLAADPALVAHDPYGSGWIAEIRADRAGDLDALLHADHAAERARLAARRFGRLAAFNLLSAAESAWIDLDLIHATHRAIGPGASMDIVRECLS